MATTPICAPASRRWACPMWPAFCRTPRCGRPARGRCRPRPGRAADGRRSGLRRDAKHQPVSVKELALGLPERLGARSTWREGTAEQPVLALCPRAGSRRASRLQAQREPTGRMAADRVARGREGADQILALDPAATTSRFVAWSIWPSCAGASSATIRNSSRKSGSGTSRAAAGAASIITPRCASRPTDS